MIALTQLPRLGLEDHGADVEAHAPRSAAVAVGQLLVAPALLERGTNLCALFRLHQRQIPGEAAGPIVPPVTALVLSSSSLSTSADSTAAPSTPVSPSSVTLASPLATVVLLGLVLLVLQFVLNSFYSDKHFLL